MAHLDAVGPDVVIVVAVVPGVGIAAHFVWLGAAVEASRRGCICNLAERRLLVCEAVYMPVSLSARRPNVKNFVCSSRSRTAERQCGQKASKAWVHELTHHKIYRKATPVSFRK